MAVGSVYTFSSAFVSASASASVLMQQSETNQWLSCFMNTKKYYTANKFSEIIIPTRDIYWY